MELARRRAPDLMRYDARHHIKVAPPVKAVARACWDILLLRRPPQVFPKSWALFTAVAAVYFLTDALTSLLAKLTLVETLKETVFDVGLQMVFFALVLSLGKVSGRFNQALTAWFGAGIFINLLEVPDALIGRFLKSDPGQVLAGLLYLFIVAWSMAVMAHILRHTLKLRPVQGFDWSLAIGFIIAGVYVEIDYWLTYYLFPG